MRAADSSYHAAIDQYTAAIARNPASAVLLSNRAAAHIKVEEYGSAIADAGAAIKIDPAYVKARSSSPCTG